MKPDDPNLQSSRKYKVAGQVAVHVKQYTRSDGTTVRAHWKLQGDNTVQFTCVDSHGSKMTEEHIGVQTAFLNLKGKFIYMAYKPTWKTASFPKQLKVVDSRLEERINSDDKLFIVDNVLILENSMTKERIYVAVEVMVSHATTAQKWACLENKFTSVHEVQVERRSSQACQSISINSQSSMQSNVVEKDSEGNWKFKETPVLIGLPGCSEEQLKEVLSGTERWKRKYENLNRELEINEKNLRRERREYNCLLENANGRHKAELNNVEFRHKTELENVKGVHKAELKNAEARHKDELDKAEARHKYELEKAEARHKDEMAQAEELHTSRKRACTELQQKNDELVMNLKEQHFIKAQYAKLLRASSGSLTAAFCPDEVERIMDDIVTTVVKQSLYRVLFSDYVRTAKYKDYQILCAFDQNRKYGSCVGIPRSRRWKRAHRLNLNPPKEVMAIIKASSDPMIERDLYCANSKALRIGTRWADSLW